MARLLIVGLALVFHAGTLPALQASDPVVAVTERFELRSDPRVALHHFLIDWASADAGEWPPYALPIAERDDWRAALDAEEQRVWSSAVEAYGAAVGRSLLSDYGLLTTRAWAVGDAARSEIPPADRALADALEAALPIYVRHWWPAHDERNRAWIDSVATRLGEVENDMIVRFEAAYGGVWPDERIPIDVMVHANALGAYSTAGRLTISSVPRGNQMPHAIEMVFHEASHADPMDRPLRANLGQAFEAAGVPEPDRFWHDVIFYTAGEITRLVLAEHGEPGYEHYGSLGVYRRGERWVVQLPAFEEHWRPFLESGSDDDAARRAALQALAGALSEDTGARFHASEVRPVDGSREGR